MNETPGCDCSRRSFLRGAGLTLAGVGIATLFPGPWIRYAMGTGPFNNKRLIFIFLRGGNDGLNAVIPGGDPDYSALNRPTLYIPPASSIDLNGFARLHPALADLTEIYGTGRLAVVHRAGFANNSRSHFDDQRTWENGNPADPKSYEGWLYRYIVDSAVDQGVKLPALSVQALPPVILRGAENFVNVANPDSFDYILPDPKRSKLMNSWRTIYTDLTGLDPYRAALTDTSVKLIDTLDTYRAWDQTHWDPKDPGTGYSLFPVSDATNPPDPSGPNGRKFAATSYGFFKSLKICALSTSIRTTARARPPARRRSSCPGSPTACGRCTSSCRAPPPTRAPTRRCGRTPSWSRCRSSAGRPRRTAASAPITPPDRACSPRAGPSTEASTTATRRPGHRV
ncbi:MAG: hypothetical protein AUG09_01490 [Acidobacteria bacterium 13_1_20CM_2_68_7]|nr:MAG: hypothetical protein AUG09_01490 [Acidobacteria bacterium 13_1_20CM_2_68_7]